MRCPAWMKPGAWAEAAQRRDMAGTQMMKIAERLRLYGRWWVARGWTSPRAWRAIAIGVAVLAVLLALFRQPLAERFWPE